MTDAFTTIAAAKQSKNQPLNRNPDPWNILLGSGGQGEVWLLKKTDPPMVMKKVFHTNDYAGYLREIRALKELSHEHVVRYYDEPANYPGIDRDQLLIFMEYCEHGSLNQVLKDTNLVYSMATVAKWAREMFSALEYIKSMKKVHHDVKPDNLFVHGHDYTLKLGDFGIVRDVMIGAILRGGTRGYMAPEVLNRDQEAEGEDVYKCDIYGAGWTCLDMVDRGNPGSQDVDGILQDELSDTFRALVVGCTKDSVEERFGVEKALELCKTISEEFKGFHAKPDPDRKPKSLMPPIGLSERLRARLQLAPVDTTNSFCATLSQAEIGVHESNVVPAKLDPRERLLMELKEKLGTTVEVRVRILHNRLWESRSRKEMCEEILTNLSSMTIENQYECAELMERLSKIDFKTIAKRLTFGLDQTLLDSMKISNETMRFPEISAIFRLLAEGDRYQQEDSQAFAIRTLAETDRATLSHWDILLHLDQAIKDIEDMAKTFTTRSVHQIINLEDSRYSWYDISDHGIFLRKDGTETRAGHYKNILLPRHYTGEWEPLNNEQIRRALMEARTYYKRKLRNQRVLFATILRETCGLPWEMVVQLPILDISETDGALTCLKTSEIQPFDGYFFRHGIPPTHQCIEGECAITGGYPSWADADSQVPSHECLTIHQNDYMETYTLMTRALKYIGRWENEDPWGQQLIEAFLSECGAKERPWVFFFKLSTVEDGTQALLFQFHLDRSRGTFIDNQMKLVQATQKLGVPRFTPVRIADLMPMIIVLRDHYKTPPSQWKGVAPEVMRPLINEFWTKILSATP